MKTFTLILITILHASLAYTQTVLVYRNDNKFNRLYGDIQISAQAENESTYVLENKACEAIPTTSIDSLIVRQIDVPSVYIKLTDYETIPELTDKELYLNATVQIKGNGYINDMEPTPALIKGRGNTTWTYPKKPYRIKFAKKQSIGNLNQCKSYVLLANFLDDTKIKNSLAFWIAQQLDVKPVNHFLPCDVYLNNIYKGTYIMTEKIGISKGSVNIDEDTGVLMEMDKYYDEKYKFRSQQLNLPVMIKDPDFDDPSSPTLISPTERLALWQEDFNKAEQNACAGHGFDSFDLNSFVNYHLVNDIVGNNEIGFPKSLYMYKSSLNENEKYKFGPLWDFDLSFNLHKMTNGEITSSPHPKSVLWVNLLFVKLKQDTRFREAYQSRLAHFINNIYPNLTAFIDAYTHFIEPTAKADGQLWREVDFNKGNEFYVYSSFHHAEQVAKLKSWLAQRIEYLKSEYNIQ